MSEQERVAALNRMGQLAYQNGDAAEALRLFEASLAVEPAQCDILVHAAAALRRLARPADALACLDRAIALAPRHAGAHNNRGLLLHQSLQRPQDALASFQAAVQAQPAHAGAHFNWANALRDLGRLAEALQHHDACLALQPGHAEALHNRGVVLLQLGRPADALASFEAFGALRPALGEAHFKRGMALHALARFDEAVVACDQALALQPQRPDAWANRGVALKALGRVEEALASYERALALAPDRADLHANVGNALRDLGRLDEAIERYDRALQLQPDHGAALAQALLTRLEVCEWDGLAERCENLADRVRSGRFSGPPFVLLAAFDDPALQRLGGQAWSARQPGGRATAPADAASDGPRRLRIGYFSSDFGDHPVSHLLAGVLEAHDRRQLEVFAFSFGPGRGDAWRHRIERAVEHFTDIRGLTDADAAALARARGLDIAIDLNGYTRHHRCGLFAAGCAPVQISYLGYLGSLGAPFMDYVVADAAMLPAHLRAHCSEKVIELPTYQCNDDRPLDVPALDRAQAGLPAEAFVYASFNSNHKLMPAVFAAWLRILQRVPGSVLWLYVDHRQAMPRLQRAAAQAGVDPSRLLFAARVPLAQHLARLPLAGLFLDTFPCNAGATASNALRMGLPVLSCAGQSMASRMGASLLHAVGLPELVTDSLPAYEDLAAALGRDAGRLAALRERLAQQAPRSRLFDTRAFTRSFEAACFAVHERQRQGLPPDHVVIRPSG